MAVTSGWPVPRQRAARPRTKRSSLRGSSGSGASEVLQTTIPTWNWSRR
ncbi:hypothetical protein [Streptomyces shenzhenensis]|nr:hypothetical protein [Streptomyces shenzhenensis]